MGQVFVTLGLGLGFKVQGPTVTIPQDLGDSKSDCDYTCNGAIVT